MVSTRTGKSGRNYLKNKNLYTHRHNNLRFQSFYKHLPTVFMHIPKTGGTSISHFIASKWGDEDALLTGYEDDLDRFSRSDNVSRFSFISGHLGWKAINLYVGSCNVFTFLRDPVDRVLSNYFWWRELHYNQEVEHNGTKVRIIDGDLDWQDDITRILENKSGFWKFFELRNIQTWQIASELYNRKSYTDRQAWHISQFNLEKMFFIGLYENLKEDLNEVQLLMTREDYDIDLWMKKGADRPRSNDCPLTLRKRIAEFNAMDYDLLDVVRAARRRGR